MFRRKYSKAEILLNILICSVLVALSILIFTNRQRIIDQVTVWQFKSTSEIDSLVDRSGMNDYGKFLYLASQPVLDSTQNFNNECNRIENTTSILGCYSYSRIYIYNVTDPQLDGIREVTATHETLHAIYARLGDGEKERINALLETEYKKLESNKDYSDRMAFYARTEPGERDNELHSVIGTEISDISPELETYYGKYFSDRQKVVVLNAKYSSKFINLKNHANILAAQLTTLATNISNNSAQYNASIATLNNDILIFNNRAANSGFSSNAQFAAERAALSARVTELGLNRDSINSDIAQYDLTLAEYNSIATESRKLYSSIDSTLAPAASF